MQSRDLLLDITSVQKHNHYQQTQLQASNAATMSGLDAALQACFHQLEQQSLAHQKDTSRRLAALEYELNATRATIVAQLPASPSQASANGARRPSKDRMVLPLGLPQLSFSSEDLLELMGKLKQEVAMLFILSLLMLRRRINQIICLMPSVMVSYHMIRSLPAMLSPSIQDTFTFEDAFGRRTRLSSADFQHWEVFHARLLCKFRDTNAIQEVLEGHYSLTVSGHQDLTPVSEADWQRRILPGTTVLMNINLNAFAAHLNECPRCEQDVPFEHVWRGKRCKVCKLVIHHEFVGPEHLRVLRLDYWAHLQHKAEAMASSNTDRTASLTNTDVSVLKALYGKAEELDDLHVFDRNPSDAHSLAKIRCLQRVNVCQA